MRVLVLISGGPGGTGARRFFAGFALVPSTRALTAPKVASAVLARPAGKPLVAAGVEELLVRSAASCWRLDVRNR